MDETNSIELTSIVHRLSIAEEIWGKTINPEAEEDRVNRLRFFFRWYQAEHESEMLESTEVFAAIRILKTSTEIRRSDLAIQCSDTVSVASNGTSEAVALDLAVRSIFLTACTRRSRLVAENLSRETIFRPYWKDSESLVGYLNRVYPVSQPPQQDLLGFRADKLRASYLQSYASLRFEWTNHLSDHLVLLRGERWKKLYIFRHPAFIQVSLERLAVDQSEMAQTFREALEMGCLPPALLKETLLTMNLIFPVVGDHRSRTILEKEVHSHNLDECLLHHFYRDARDHERPGDALEPRDIKSLYEKYPYWADRLYDLWKEADDPTPITRIERWTEARKNPRFTYWCAVVSIILAFIFGMLATVLAAVQVWISWCSWIDDSTVAQCGHKQPSTV